MLNSWIIADLLMFKIKSWIWLLNAEGKLFLDGNMKPS